MKKVLNTLLTMSRPLGTLLLLLTLLCVASWNSPATAQTSTTPKLYAVLEDNGTTLAFKLDSNKPESGGIPSLYQMMRLTKNRNGIHWKTRKM